MSIVRVGQYPCEMGYASSNQPERGFFVRSGDIQTFSVSNSQAYTDSNSIGVLSRHDSGVGFPVALSDDLRGGWFMYATQQPISDLSYLTLYESDNTTPLVEVRRMQSEWTMRLYINGASVQEANLADFAEVLSLNMWSHHGWHVIGGSRFVYYIDGVAMLDYTNVGVPTQFDGVWCFQGNSWGQNYVDDFWVEIVAGESMAPVPAYRFMQSVVDGDGGSRGWANYPNSGDDYEKVDDVTVDDDATYNWINSSGTVQMYTTANVSVPFGYSVSAAIPWCLGRKGDISKASQIRLKADDGVGVTSGSDQNLPGFYAEIWERMLLDPQSAAWDATSFNACEFGFESRGTI